VDDGSGQVAYYEAEVLSASDYYPFGFSMPGRTDTLRGASRFGFNGMERDDELKGEGNSYDFGARIYDGRIGRFLSVDPMASEFPTESNYIFAGNNPVYFIDAFGAFKWPAKYHERFPKLTKYLMASYEDHSSGKKGVITEMLFSQSFVNSIIINSAHGSEPMLSDRIKYTYSTPEQTPMKINPAKHPYSTPEEGSDIVNKMLTFDGILNDMISDQGPVIDIENDLDFEEFVTSQSGNSLYISEKLLTAFENATNPKDEQAILLKIVATIYHEYLEQYTEDKVPSYLEPLNFQ